MAGHSVLRLSDLPVEVLSTIFSMVCSADKVSLAQVCERFDSVLQRRELIRSVDFQRAYELDAKQAYSFLKDKTRCNFITSVNLTGCYWLSSTTIRQCLTRLKNLETMLVADTKLTNGDLKFLFSVLPKDFVADGTVVLLTKTVSNSDFVLLIFWLVAFPRAVYRIIGSALFHVHALLEDFNAGKTVEMCESRFLKSNRISMIRIRIESVNNLAISWNGPVNIGPKIEDLQCIYLYVPSGKRNSMVELCKFLKLCKNIEKICILTSPLPMLLHYQFCTRLLLDEKVLPPHLRSLLVTTDKEVLEDFSKWFSVKAVVSPFKKNMLSNLLSSAISGWESFVIPSDLEGDIVRGEAKIIYLKRNLESNALIMDRAFFTSSEKDLFLLDDSVFQSLLKLRSLSIYCGHKDMDVAILSMFREECQLEELNIYGKYDKMVLPICEKMSATLSSGRLRKLCIPTCAIWRKKTSQPTSSSACFQGLGKRPRVSHLTANESLEDSPFLNLVQSCPNIEEFFMDNLVPDFLTLPLPDDFEWDSQQLMHIANWKKLRKLTLGGIPITSFMFLDRIGRCCQVLTSLTLNYMRLTASAVGMAGLVKALPLFTKLEDLAIRQPRGPSVLHALHQDTLRRVVLVCGSKVSGLECSQFLENCTKVVLIYIVCHLSQAETGRIKSSIQTRFADRQALVFHIVPIGTQRIIPNGRTAEWQDRSVPGIHANEMLLRDESLSNDGSFIDL